VRDEVAAVHEGGHSLAAWKAGFSIGTVQLCESGPAAGLCVVRSWRTEIDVDPINALIYVAAGPAAETRLTGRPSVGDASDRALIETLAAAITELPAEHARVRALIERTALIAKAMMLDSKNWSIVTRIAKELERKRVLTGRDIEGLIRGSMR
jgi:hypothetical protein